MVIVILKLKFEFDFERLVTKLPPWPQKTQDCISMTILSKSNSNSNFRITMTIFGDYLDHMETKKQSIRIFYFFPQIWIIILNIRDYQSRIFKITLKIGPSSQNSVRPSGRNFKKMYWLFLCIVLNWISVKGAPSPRKTVGSLATQRIVIDMQSQVFWGHGGGFVCPPWQIFKIKRKFQF